LICAISADLRNIGSINGTVAWVQDNRFGIAFDEEIDSQKARRPLQNGDDAPIGIVEASWAHRAPPPPEPAKLRKL
jgi:hypothetical protein